MLFQLSHPLPATVMPLISINTKWVVVVWVLKLAVRRNVYNLNAQYKVLVLYLSLLPLSLGGCGQRQEHNLNLKALWELEDLDTLPWQQLIHRK